MFLLRSVFWLSVAYIVIKPPLGFDPQVVADEAIAAGQTAVLQQVSSIQCEDIACAGGQALLRTALAKPPPDAVPDALAPAAADPVPLPRRRPDG